MLSKGFMRWNDGARGLRTEEAFIGREESAKILPPTQRIQGRSGWFSVNTPGSEPDNSWR